MSGDIVMLPFFTKKVFLKGYPKTLRRDLLVTPVSTFNLTGYVALMISVQKPTQTLLSYSQSWESFNNFLKSTELTENSQATKKLQLMQSKYVEVNNPVKMEKEDKGKQTSSKAEDDELDALMELISGEFIFQND